MNTAGLGQGSDPVSGVLAERSLQALPTAKSKHDIASMTMHVKVYSPQHVYFDEQATSLSATNATGPFDILPGHHNFITLVDSCELVLRRPGKQEAQRIKISGGIMHVNSQQATVFLDV